MVERVLDRGGVQLRRVGLAEPRVPVAVPLHRGADPVPVPQVDVVPHPDLVAVVQDRAAGQGEQQAVQQLRLVAVAVDQWGEPAANAEVDPHPRLGGIHPVHIVALLVRDHLERQLVVVPEE